jgi:lipoprotein signal peptidase
VLLFGLTAVLGAALDLWTKHAAFTGLGWPSERPAVPPVSACEGEYPPPGPHYELIPCWFRLQTSLNPGAIWGKLDGAGTILAVFSVAAMAFVVYWFAVLPPSQKFRQFALGLIFAGAAGNFYDRVWTRPDFVEFEITGPAGTSALHRKVGRLLEEGQSVNVGGTIVPIAELDKLTGRLDNGQAVMTTIDGRRIEGVVADDTRLVLYPNYDKPFTEQTPITVAVWPAPTAMGDHSVVGLRVRRKLGAVRDFFDLHHGSWNYPIFNVADSFLSVGVAILLLATLGEAREDLSALGGFIGRLLGRRREEGPGEAKKG